jgi:hypothetical protein
MDFIEGLPMSHGFSAILVIVDRFTKYGHFFPLKHPYSAVVVAQIFLDNIVKLHGIPKSIVCDRDMIFTSAFWTELFKLLKTDLKLSTAYHTQTDGQTERVNQCLEIFLHCSIQATPKQWTKWFPLAELWYNTSFHSSLKCSPYKAMYAVDPPMGLVPSLRFSDHQEVLDILKERQVYNDLLKEQLSKAQNRMKIYADAKRSERSFQVGDQVMLKLKPYVQTSIANRPFPKVVLKYYGPYSVTQKVGNLAYKLQLLAESKIHPVFHVSQLPLVPALDVTEVSPEQVLQHRLVKKGNVAIVQVLVKWTGCMLLQLHGRISVF